MLSARPASCLLALLLAVAGPVNASAEPLPIEGWLESSGPSSIQGVGVVSVSAGQAASSQVAPSSGYGIQCSSGNVQLWNYPVQEVRVMRDGEPEVRDVRGLEPERVHEMTLRATGLSALATEGGYSAWAFPSVDVLALAQGDGVHADGPQPTGFSGFSNPLYHVGDVQGVVLRPPGSFLWLDWDLTEPIQFPDGFSAAIFGHQIDAGGLAEITEWPVGRHLDASQTILDPVTGSGRLVWDTWIVFVECAAATIVAPDNSGVRFLADGFAGRIEGDFVWRGVQTHADVAGMELDRENHILQAFGTLYFTASTADQAIHWDFNGTVSSIVADTVPVEFPLAVAAAGGAALLVLLGVFWQSVRGFLTFVLGRSTPGLVKADVLGNKTRRRILRLLQEFPVASVPQLIEATDQSRASIRYNLRILEAHGILQAHRSPARRRLEVYSLNSQSLSIPLGSSEAIAAGASMPGSIASAQRPGVASEALAAVFTHKIRAAIFEFLQTQQSASRQALLDHLGHALNRDIASSTLHDHLKVLEGSGALRRRVTAREERWEAAFTLEGVQSVQLMRFLRATGLLRPLVQILEPVQGRSGTPSRTSRKALAYLQALGLVERGPDDQLFVPTRVRRRLVSEQEGRIHAA